MSRPALKKFIESSYEQLENSYYRCRSCNRNIKQLANHGATNLKNHMKAKHGEALNEFLCDLSYSTKERQPSIVSSSRKISDAAERIFKWLHFIVMTNQSYSIVDNEYMRGISNIEPICCKTLSKYLVLVGDKVTSMKAYMNLG